MVDFAFEYPPLELEEISPGLYSYLWQMTERLNLLREAVMSQQKG